MQKLLKTSLITGYRRLRTNVWNIKIFLLNLIFLFLNMIRQTFLLVNTPNGYYYSSCKGFGLSRCDLWPLLKPCLECYCDYSVGGAKKITCSPSCTKSYRCHLKTGCLFYLEYDTTVGSNPGLFWPYFQLYFFKMNSDSQLWRWFPW